MTDLVPHTPSHAASRELASMTTDYLKQRLAEQMELSARHLVEMATIWAELERRGEDLSALRTGLTDYLPRIAAGTLDARAVVQLAGNRLLLRHFAMLPLDQQQTILGHGEVEVVLPESREVTQRKLAYLSAQEVRQVFGKGQLRSPAEQERIISGADQASPKRATARKPAARIHYGTLEVDGKRITASGKPLSAQQMLALLSDHYGVDLQEVVNGQPSSTT